MKSQQQNHQISSVFRNLSSATQWAKRVCAALLFVCFGSLGIAAANNIYVAQASAGAATGSDCADAYAISFVTSNSNWGSGANQIGPGTTVYFCGTITSNLNFMGSGTSGNPIVFDGTSATMSAYIGNITAQYWTLQNFTWSTSYGTNNTNQAVIQASSGAAYATIQNNHIDIMSSGQVLFLDHGTHDITVLNNYMRMSTPAAGSGFQSDNFDSAGAYNVLVEGNVIAAAIGAGDEACAGCHDDLIQVWASSGTPANSPYNWTIRYNNFLQESSPAKVNNQSFLMMEEIGTGTAGYWDVYSNVFQCVSSGSSGNGIVFDSNGSGMTANIYNNTIVENAGACNNLLNLSGNGTFNLENNIIYNSDAGNALTGGVTFATRQNNLWYGPNLPSCVSSEICNQNPQFTNYSGSNFTLTSSSPARNAAVNLGSSFDQVAVAGATWPNPSLSTRPGSGNWDIGAYQYSTSTSSTPPPAAPNPPTGLTATVQQ
jgi:hypothetical protein